MKPTKELLEIAKVKAANLLPNTQIRLTADVESYWVFNKAGHLWIGWLTSEGKLPKFFANRPEYKMQRPDGTIMGELQRLV